MEKKKERLRIKIKDLPKDMKISDEEMKEIMGGGWFKDACGAASSALAPIWMAMGGGGGSCGGSGGSGCGIRG